MIRKTSRKLRVNTVNFKLSDKVALSVPKEDRQNLQTPRIPGVIIRVLEDDYFEIQCSGGILKDKYQTENLGRFNGDIALNNVK